MKEILLFVLKGCPHCRLAPAMPGGALQAHRSGGTSPCA
jgi:hypothetical protein